MRIIHCMKKAVWEREKEKAFIGQTYIDAEGFIHCSQTDTFRAVTPLFRDQMEPLVLLVIDTDKLTAPLKWEGEPVKYPHIYAAFNRDAVTDVLPYRKDRGGEWIVNDELL